MSSFAAKRKARVIKIDDEEGSEGSSSSGVDNQGPKDDQVKPSFGSKTGRKPFRQSGLRKAFNSADEDGADVQGASAPQDEEEDDGPVVVRPNANRSGSLKQKKKIPKSRLSFGGDPEEGDGEELATPKKAPLGKRALENSAVKRGIALRTLPTRSAQDDDEDRPRYSKEYLEELQSSTPSTPRDVGSLNIEHGDDMELDPSELDGALVVDSTGPPSESQGTQILSEAEIRERKERRARLAKEQDFLSVEDDDETDPFGRKKKDDSRLVAEDEELGEGFDDYVEDGRLSLGKRAVKERSKQERRQMAELITAAEGHSSDSSSDSDAERRIAYEASQSKAGLDGLKKPKKNQSEDIQVPPKITPIPTLTECLARLQASLKSMEGDLKAKNSHLANLRKEKDEIVQREAEVQALLDETGKKYQEAMGQGKVEGAAVSGGSDVAAGLATERGLDSLGTTPQRANPEDVDMS